MTTALADLVDPLKREVATPGSFVDAFPAAEDSDLLGTLADSFWEARLDGFFTGVTETAGTLSQDVSRDAAAVIVIYAGVRMLKSEIRNRSTRTRAKSGSSEFEREQGASILVQLLRDAEARKRALVEDLIRRPASATGVYTADGYYIRATGFWPGELAC